MKMRSPKYFLLQNLIVDRWYCIRDEDATWRFEKRDSALPKLLSFLKMTEKIVQRQPLLNEGAIATI